MILGIIYKIILLICSIQSYLLGRKYQFSAQNYLFFYFIITFLIETTSFALYYVNKQIDVGLLYHFYSLFSVIYFGWFYAKSYNEKFNFPFVSMAITIVAMIFFTDFFHFYYDNKNGFFCSIFFLVNSTFWFYQKLKSDEIIKISDTPYFWISTGLLLWSTVFLFRIIPIYYFKDDDFQDILKAFVNAVNIIMYLLFYIALIKFDKKSKIY